MTDAQEDESYKDMVTIWAENFISVPLMIRILHYFILNDQLEFECKSLRYNRDT